MKVPQHYTLVLGILLLCVACQPILAQQSTTSSSLPVSLSQALTLATSALSSSTLPADITLQASMQITAGGRNETATLNAAARGAAQSYEVVAGPYTQTSLVFSNGQAAINGIAASLELASTAQSPLYPAALLAAIATDPNTSGQVFGLEAVNGLQLLHFTTWSNSPSLPGNYLASFTQRDWWIDPSSGLLHKLVFQRRAAGGAIAPIRYEYEYVDFQNAGTLLVPSTVTLSLNGTPYAAIAINSVQLNTGLTDENFPVQ